MSGGPYLTDGLRQRLDLVQYLAQYGRLCLYVGAPPGSGRSTFVAELLRRGEGRWEGCLLAGAEVLGRSAALGRLARMLRVGGDGGGEAALRRAVREALAARTRARRVVVVVLDDVDRAPAETVELLLELFSTPESGCLRLVFTGPAGYPESGGPVAQALAAAVTHTVDLPPFDADELRGYLRHRLGTEPDEALVRDVLRRGGRPGDVEAVLGADGRRRGRRPWYAAVAALVVAGVLVWWTSGGRQDEPAVRPLPLPPPAAPAATEEAAAEPGPAAEAAPMEPPVASLREPKPGPGAAPTPPAEAFPGEGPGPAAGPGEGEAAAGAPPAGGAPAEETLAAGPAPRTAPPSPSGDETAAAAAQLPGEGAGAVVKEEAAAAATGPAPHPARSGMRDAAWVRSRPAGRWTLQLVGARDEAAVRAYAARAELEGPLAVVAIRRDGGDWFVLLWGDFPDRAAALAARARLPARLRVAGPWPRRFAEVAAALR